ncbi:MAG TPA: hypothetical protein VLW25_08210 [Bryobacteraceae bacterium]|nr:hypothetical protein [Bryobacteraceae bacterium]
MVSRAITLAAGCILLGKSVTHWSGKSWLVGLVGVELILLGLGAHDPRRSRSSRRRRISRRVPEPDIVELASELSFPASDAPAY